MEKLKVEKISSDRTFSDYTIEGLSVEEMNRIFDPQGDGSRQDDRLQEILDAHNPGLGTAWRCGYGIYSVRHVGGILMVKVGNSCD